MLSAFKKSGEFNIYTDSTHLSTDKLARRGGIYLRVGHTLMVLSNGSGVGEEQPVPESTMKPPYVLVLGGSVYVRTGGSTAYEITGKVHKGDKFPYVGKAVGGWHMIEFGDMTAFISNRSNLTKLVLK